eukprot:409197_1
MSTKNDIDIGIGVRWVVFITHVIVHSFIAFPIVLYSYFQFNHLTKNHKLLIIQKRYPSIVKLQCYICFFILIIERNLKVFLNGSFVDLIDPNVLFILARIQRVIYPAMSILIWCILWRFWHIYYEVQLSKALSDSRWMRYLNSSMLRCNWFISNKYKYGLTTYTTKVMLVFLLVITIIRITTFQIFMSNGEKALYIEYIVDMILYLMPCTLIVVLACKAPSIQNTFYIKQEVTYCAIHLYGSLFGCIVFVVISQTNIVESYWLNIIFSYILTWAALSVCIVQTSWVKYKVQQASRKSDEYGPIAMTNMKQYIKTREGFDLFIAHLQQEFSLELMLFFIEVFQFKTLIKSNCEDGLLETDTNRTNKINVAVLEHETQGFEIENEFEHDDYKLSDYESILMNLRIPQSEIVHQLFEKERPNLNPTPSIHSDFSTGVDITALKTVSFLLDSRYIKRGSQLEINISCGCRQSLEEQLGDIETLVRNDKIGLIELYHYTWSSIAYYHRWSNPSEFTHKRFLFHTGSLIMFQMQWICPRVFSLWFIM